MSKLFIFGLACICALLSHSVTATIIEQQFFTTHDCSGTSFFSSNITAGACMASGGISFAYYPSSDFLFTDIVVFQDSNCTLSQVEGVVHGGVGCGDTGSLSGSFWSTTIFHVDADLPVNPVGQFPPPNYAVTTQYLDATTSAKISTCDGVGAKTYLSATRLDCRAANNLQQGASTQVFCNGVEGANFQYSDSQCQNVARVELVGIPSCDNGQTVSCPAGPNFDIPTIPANLTAGGIQFDNTNCDVNPKTNSTLSLPGVCFANVTMSCYQDVNGTTRWTTSTYNTSDCSGTVVEFRDILPDTCYGNGSWAYPNTSATCTGTVPRQPPPSNSSSSSSSSSSSTGAAVGGSSSSTGAAGGVTSGVSTSSSSTGAVDTTATFTISLYTTADCSGVPLSTYPQAVGGCLNFSEFSVAYYVSPDGQFIYGIEYEGNGCVSTAAAIEIFQESVACSATSNGYYSQTTIANLQNAPVNPLGNFPPAGWAVETFYLNATTGESAATCGGGAGIITYQIAKKYDHCYKNAITGGSSHFFCSVSSNLDMEVSYSDSQCSNPVRVETVSLDDCDHGRKVTCPASGSTPTLPKTLSIGYTEHDNVNCTTNPQADTTLSIPNVCYNGVVYSCGLLNGTTYFQWKVYSDVNCTGFQVDGGANLPGTCAVNPHGQPYAQATCDTTPPPSSGPAPSSSSSSSSSSSTAGPTISSSSTGSDGNVNVSSSTGIDYNSGASDLTSSFMTIISAIILVGMSQLA